MPQSTKQRVTKRRDYDMALLTNAPQQKRSHDNSLRILQAAERVILKRGSEAFTIAAVAKEADVSVGGIYGRFKNREELLKAIHVHFVEQLRDSVEGSISGQFNELSDLLLAFTAALADFFEQRGKLLLTVSAHSNASSAARIEGDIRNALIKAAAPFRSDIAHSNPDIALRIVVHLMLASLIRELGTKRTLADRLMGWSTLREELPRMAVRYLTSTS